MPCQQCAPNIAQSSVSLGYKFGSTEKGFPIQIFSFQRKAQEGLIEHPSFFEFRRSIGCIQTTRNVYRPQENMTQDFKPIKLNLDPLSEKVTFI